MYIFEVGEGMVLWAVNWTRGRKWENYMSPAGSMGEMWGVAFPSCPSSYLLLILFISFVNIAVFSTSSVQTQLLGLPEQWGFATTQSNFSISEDRWHRDGSSCHFIRIEQPFLTPQKSNRVENLQQYYLLQMAKKQDQNASSGPVSGTLIESSSLSPPFPDCHTKSVPLRPNWLPRPFPLHFHNQP